MSWTTTTCKQTTTQLSYLHYLITVQPPRSTRFGHTCSSIYVIFSTNNWSFLSVCFPLLTGVLATFSNSTVLVEHDFQRQNDQGTSTEFHSRRQKGSRLHSFLRYTAMEPQRQFSFLLYTVISCVFHFATCTSVSRCADHALIHIPIMCFTSCLTNNSTILLFCHFDLQWWATN